MKIQTTIQQITNVETQNNKWQQTKNIYNFEKRSFEIIHWNKKKKVERKKEHGVLDFSECMRCTQNERFPTIELMIYVRCFKKQKETKSKVQLTMEDQRPHKLNRGNKKRQDE